MKCKFYGLRQQLDMGESTYWCQGDFIAPKAHLPAERLCYL